MLVRGKQNNICSRVYKDHNYNFGWVIAIATLLFDPSMSALPIIVKQNSQSVGLFTRLTSQSMEFLSDLVILFNNDLAYHKVLKELDGNDYTSMVELLRKANKDLF